MLLNLEFLCAIPHTVHRNLWQILKAVSVSVCAIHRNLRQISRITKKYSKEMAVNTPLFTVAAAVAAIGAFCKFESHCLPSRTTTTDTDGHHNESYGRQDCELNGKSKAERTAAKFAPQFDGLHCYETLVRF